MVCYGNNVHSQIRSLNVGWNTFWR